MDERRKYWLGKLKGLVPGWLFTQTENPEDSNVERFFNALASVFQGLEKTLNDNISQTFIRKSSGQFLDQHAKERGVFRRQNEGDPSLRERTINLRGATDCPRIKGTVDGLFPDSRSTNRVIDGDNLNFFVGDFLGQDTIITDDDQRDIFSVVVDKESGNLNELTETIEAQKAFGIGWRLIERA